MTIVVVGATGLIGAKLAHILTANGQQVLAASRSTGVDVLTGEGVSDALRGAEAVIDVTDSASYEDDAPLEFFTTSTANLVAAERTAGVAHHVALSVVGADRMPDSGYMRAKVAQEAGIVGSGVAYTVLRATQFFEFACGIADSCTDENTVRVPDALIQPIAATEVAARLAAIGAGAPANAIVELGGPECLSFEHFIRAVLTRYGDTRTVSTDPHARYFGTALEPRTLVAADTAARGRLRLANWLAGR
ncbi:SDR family oxidoreductase [Mycobacterium malmoense]|uniref:SDR family oxidoreductase n=1 Tax=Mycobacterium malmoense TaxID=1780 RepID=UPI0008F80C57|nr:sugar nucleotide-binding protein [Mycobacterium malmoense]OIN80146.1 NmrA family transcriptional regulator [Mycobacterium malmoense]